MEAGGEGRSQTLQRRDPGGESGRDGERLIPEAQRLDDLELARMVSWIMHLGTQAAVNQGELVAIESEAP